MQNTYQDLITEIQSKNPQIHSKLEGGKKVSMDMTLTSPNCPVAESLPMEVRRSVETIPEVEEVEVKIVWEPAWDKTKMSEAAKLELNL